MDTALILHGWGGSYNTNWFPWLEKKLICKTLDVYVPNLPNTENPILEDQKDYIDVYASDFKRGGYIFGHSLGAKLATLFIEEHKIKNSVVVLVAPVYPGLAEEKGEEIFGDSYDNLKYYFNYKQDFEEINNLNNKFVIFLSDNDPYINIEKAKEYYGSLNNVKFVEFKDKGHFMIPELEEILEYIK